MTDSSYFDFYDCNSSSNSFLKFETSSLSSDSPPIVGSPSLASNSSTPNNFDKMDSMSNSNPLLTTASMPIPTNQSRSGVCSNNTRTMADLSDVVFDFEKSQSPLSAINNETLNQTALKQTMINYDTIVGSSGIAVYDLHNNSYNQATWDEEVSRLLISDNQAMVGGGDKSETFQMDEDDIFQVDKSDLFQEQTMSDLNGDTFYEMLSMEEILSADSNQQYIHQINNSMGHFTQLTAVNFQNLQNAINENNSGMNNECLSPSSNVYQTIPTPQTPHNTPITSYQSHGGHMLFYDDPTNNSSPSPYDVYTPASTVTTSLSISTPPHGNTNNKTSTTTPGQLAAFSPGSHNSSTSTSSVVLNSSLSPPPSLPPHSTFTPSRVRSPRTATARSSQGGQVQHNPKYSTLHSLLMKKDPTAAEKAMLGKLQHASSPPTQLLTPGGNPSRRLNMNGGSVISRLSSSAPTQIGFEQIWQRREPKPHLLSTGSLAEGQPGSTSSLSGGLLSPENPDFSQDETFSDEEDSDHYEDLTSGKIKTNEIVTKIQPFHYILDSDIEDNKDLKIFNSDPNNNQNFKGDFGTPNSKKGRYFWQYNVQAKGPKGQRLVIKQQLEDPHYLNEVTDPVFSPNCSVRGIKVSI